MRLRSVRLTLIYAMSVAPALASAPETILTANHAATGGVAWDGKSTLVSEYSFAGQGLKGHASAIVDLHDGRFVQALDAGPASATQGFDGTHSWNKDNTGIVTLPEGRDALPLAVNQAYRNANLWWSRDFGGAVVKDNGKKSDALGHFDVLTFSPRGGTAFDAWFDRKSHLLARIVEQQGGIAVTTTFSD